MAVFMIVFAIFFMVFATSMFAGMGGGFGFMIIPFLLVPGMMIVQAVRALMSKDSTVDGGYVIEKEDDVFYDHRSNQYINPTQLHQTSSQSVDEKLRKLKTLKEQGLISEEDYNRKVDDLLDKEF